MVIQLWDFFLFETFFHKSKKSVWQQNMTRSRKRLFLPTKWRRLNMCSIKVEEIKTVEKNIWKLLLVGMVIVIYICCEIKRVNLILGESRLKWIQMFPTTGGCSSVNVAPSVGRHPWGWGSAKSLLPSEVQLFVSCFVYRLLVILYCIQTVRLGFQILH